MKRNLLILWFITCAMLCRAELVYQHFSVEDGMSQNTVMSILQDSKGYMWFGTWDGLNKFDGYQFTIFKSHPGSDDLITNNRIDFLYEDALGYIWFQTYDGRLHRLDQREERFFSIPTLSRKFANNIDAQRFFVESRPGELWIDAVDSLVHVAGAEPEVTYYSMNGTINFIVAGKDSSIWVGTDKGLLEIHDGQIKKYSELSQFSVTAAYPTEKTIWFGTSDGVLFRKIYDKIGFERFTLDQNPKIEDLEVVENRYVVATSDHGFYVYDHIKHLVTNYSASNSPLIDNDAFHNVVLDSYGTIWLENEQNGIFTYNLKTQQLNHLAPQPDSRYAHNIGANLIILEDANGQVWVNPNGGGFGMYNCETGQIDKIPNLTNIVHTAYVDNAGSLWLSTYAKGVDRITEKENYFHFLDLDDEVRALYWTKDGYIIVGTKDGITHLFNGSQKIGQLDLSYRVYGIVEDNSGNVWLGTRGNGILVINKHNAQIIKHYKHDPNDPTSVSNNDIYSMLIDSAENIYVGTYGGGLNILPKDSDSFLNFGNGLVGYPMELCSKIRTMVLDSKGILWVGTTNGLLQMNTENRTIRYNAKERANANSLSNNDIHTIFEDSDGVIWIGTFGGGLNMIADNEWSDFPLYVESFNMEDGLFSDIVLNIEEDNNGNLWFTSENTISKFDKSNFQYQNFNVFKAASNSFFTESNAIKLPSGELMFATNTGLCVFDPQMIMRSNAAPKIEFTRFQLFNSDVPIGDDSPLQTSISYADRIVLKHDQTVFSIEYVALDFSEANIQYAFMLDGFEKQWNFVEEQRKATYTNIPQGTYVFRVRSTNAEGLWLDNEQTIEIVVKPSFWQTPWAIVIYTILIALLAYFAYLVFKRYNDLRQNVEVEQKVTDIKLRFFTNISHELRTPLTLISGPVENILTNEYISPSVRDQLEIVKNNSDRMLRLINQILDFRKIQNKKMRLKIQKTNIDQLVHQTCANFNKETVDKQIKLNIVSSIQADTELYLDRDKTDIILYNLLSNAFKFTPAGKNINVILSGHNDFITVAVQDEGIGIEQSKVSTLFERFTSNNELNANFNVIGTGIGLNLVKELVDLHHGYIDVKSEQGKGSVFTIMFRKGKDHFNGEADFIIDDQLTAIEPDNYTTKQPKIVENIDKPTVLVVDDSEDMCTFLAEILNSKFNIEVAHDGNEGVAKAKELSPALIISDLMMPNKDGLELTNELKQDMATSHIPIILLTAKTAIENRLEAMRFGADDYITKPFSPIYLTARIENILEQRLRLQESYRKSLMNLEPQVENKTSPDQIFLAKLMAVMDRNIDNSELTVDSLLSEMAMGRTVFYNKLKGLTGFSPVEFIREVRIKRAAQLLEMGQYSITEITYMVGMNDARYFSKCFKAVYGVTPSDYKRNMSK